LSSAARTRAEQADHLVEGVAHRPVGRLGHDHHLVPDPDRDLLREADPEHDLAEFAVFQETAFHDAFVRARDGGLAPGFDADQLPPADSSRPPIRANPFSFALAESTWSCASTRCIVLAASGTVSNSFRAVG
jgi:hypothetical protein